MRLDYASGVRAPERLSLTEDEEYCTLTFPLMPAWLSLLPVVTGFLSMSMFGCFSIWLMREAAKSGLPLVWKLWEAWGMILFAALIWGLIAARSLRNYKRYGGVPLSFSLNRAMRVLRIQAQGSGRWRELPVARIRDVNLKTLRSLIPRHSVTEMVIRFRGFYLPIRQRFKGDDVLLGEKFALEVNRMIALHRDTVSLDPSPSRISPVPDRRTPVRPTECNAPPSLP